MTPTHRVTEIARPGLLPIGFALVLAILATCAALTSERLWTVEAAEAPAVQMVAR